MISVIIPTLNNAATLPRVLAPLVDGVTAGIVRQVVVADGGSQDETLEIADAAGCDMITAPARRSAQLCAGACAAKGAWLFVLNADAALAPGWGEAVGRFLKHPSAAQRVAAFTLAFEDGSAALWANVRARWLKSPRAAHGLLISRVLYDEIAGFRDVSGEDADIVRRIGARRLVLLEAEIVTLAPCVTQREAMRESSGV
jgi:glycosyltransferase involved in cell wall biosynthesis